MSRDTTMRKLMLMNITIIIMSISETTIIVILVIFDRDRCLVKEKDAVTTELDGN